MFKNILEKGKCALGFHAGEWQYLAEKDCTLVRVCVRCGTESTRVEHVAHPAPSTGGIIEHTHLRPRQSKY